MVEAAKAKEDLLQKHHTFSLMVNDYSLPPNAAGDNVEEMSDLTEEIMNLDDTDVKTFHDRSELII